MTAEAVLFLIVEGEPVPKARPRVVGRQAYTPPRTVQAEATIGWRMREAYPGLVADGESRFALSCTFYRRMRTRADGDNLLKLVADALINVVYVDDAQVVDWHGRIVQSELLGPQTVILITRLPGPALPAKKGG